MMLAIDTSAALSAVALLDGDRVVGEVVRPSRPRFEVAAEVAALAPDPRVIDAVLVALGPGSFTGLRQGLSFGIGLALSLGVPLLGLGTLDWTALRSLDDAVSVVDAGRGRLYFQAPDGRRGVGTGDEVPGEWPAIGWLRDSPLPMVSEERQRGFGASSLLARGRAREVGYGTVSPEYMQHFGRLDGER